MRDVAEGLRSFPVAREGCAQKERKVDPRQSELARAAQHRRQHQGAHEPAGERTPDRHGSALVSDIAALISARWVSA